MDKKEQLKLDFFMSRIKLVKDIRETSKTKISVVLYDATETTCILRICKGRDLSSVCDALLKVKNPNVALIYSYVYAGGSTYIIEEMLSGMTLEEVIENEGVLSEKETSKIILEVISGLSDFHNMTPPVIHNDINTSNIMLCDDSRVKLFDFDISRTYKEESSKNTELFGTEECASPEHYGYGQSEPRTDIYCLGVTMHKMLTGEYLSKDRKCLYKGRMKKIIEKCIRIDPKDRYSSLAALRKDLEKILDAKKTLVKIAAFMGVVLVAAVGLYFAFGKGDNSAQVEKNAESYHTQSAVSTEAGENDTTLSFTEPTDRAEDSQSAVLTIRPEGQVISMVSSKNLGMVFLEKTAEGYSLKSSDGTQKTLDFDFQVENCSLIENPQNNSLYLITTCKDEASVYPLNESLEIGDAPAYIGKQSYVSQIKGFFFDDGVMYCNAFDRDLIDTNIWKECGFANYTPLSIINNRIYDLGDNFYTLEEITSDGETLSVFEIPGETLFTRIIYVADDLLYLDTKIDNKTYIYTFDGEKFSEFFCLEDNTESNVSKLTDMVISEDKIWLYDSNTNTIKGIEKTN